MTSFEQRSPGEKLEHQIAASTVAGREALAVMELVSQTMTGSEKVAKAFELTEMSRQIMLAGIRVAHPNASETEIRELYVDRLLSYHGTSLAQLRSATAPLRSTKN